MNKSKDVPFTIMPETSNKAFCMESTKPISKEGFALMTSNLDKIIKEQGKARLLTYFKSYKGWDEDAVTADMDFTLNYGDKLERIAIVNAPDKFIYMVKTKGSLFQGDVKFFSENELAAAISWINE